MSTFIWKLTLVFGTRAVIVANPIGAVAPGTKSAVAVSVSSLRLTFSKRPNDCPVSSFALVKSTRVPLVTLPIGRDNLATSLIGVPDSREMDRGVAVSVVKSGNAGLNVIVWDAEKPVAPFAPTVVTVTSAVPAVSGANSCVWATPSALVAMLSLATAFGSSRSKLPAVVLKETARVGLAGLTSARSIPLDAPSASTWLKDGMRRMSESADAGWKVTVTEREARTSLFSLTSAVTDTVFGAESLVRKIDASPAASGF